jgi:competence protein ComEC
LNPIAIPGMALAQVAAMFAVFADVVAPPLAGLAGFALRAGASAVVDSASFVDRVPWLAWRVPPPGAAAVVAYYTALAAWVWLRSGGAIPTRTRRRVSTATLAGVVCWVAVAPTSVWPARDTTLTVTALDVGQGDALLVRFPDGTRMLVDAGGRSGSGFDVGDRVVGPALRARGVRRLDYVVVTHADTDHVGGAAAVVREFRPAEVWVGVPVAGNAATAGLREAAEAAGAAWRETRDGDRLWLGRAELSVLHPPPADWERQRVRNDDSVVLLIRLGAVQVLLTGDIGDAGERTLTGMLPDTGAARSLTVLKVAHHGSAGASSARFLERLRPAVALVSAGAGNPFGHPAPAVLQRLSQAGAEVWRTDTEGEVSVRTDGRTVDVVAFSGRRRRLQPQPR